MRRRTLCRAQRAVLMGPADIRDERRYGDCGKSGGDHVWTEGFQNRHCAHHTCDPVIGKCDGGRWAACLFCDGTRLRFSLGFCHRTQPLRPYCRCFTAIRMGQLPDSCLRGLRKNCRLFRCRYHDFFCRDGCSRHRDQNAATQSSTAFHHARLSVCSSSIPGDLRMDSYFRRAHTLGRNDTGVGNRTRRASDLLAPFPRCEGEGPKSSDLVQFLNP